MPNTQSGYIAITSVIIISLLLVTVSVALSSANYFSRFNVLESEFKERSSSLAEACVDQAMFNIASNNLYNGNVAVGANSCTIVSVTVGNPDTIVKTQGVFQNSYTNLVVEVKNSNLAIVSWQETPN